MVNRLLLLALLLGLVTGGYARAQLPDPNEAGKDKRTALQEEGPKPGMFQCKRFTDEE